MTNYSFLKTSIASIAIVLFSFNLNAKNYSFEGKSWTIINVTNNSQASKQLSIENGIEILQLPKSYIALLDNSFKNFTLEFDIKGGAMPGVGFRSDSLINYEYFYLRLGNSGKNSALQYFPVYNCAESWMIYNYPKYESFAEFPDNDWIHVKFDVFNDNMRVFINNNETPNMEVKLKNTDLTSGQIFLKSGFADSFFKNVKINEMTDSFNIEETTNPNKYIQSWNLSEQFKINFNGQPEIYSNYEKQTKNHNWIQAKADNDGIVNISKYYSYPRNTIIAISELYSDFDKEIDLLFDYTFSIVIGLNDEILFCGTEMDSKNNMRMMDAEENLKLNLKQGKNKLVFFIKADDVWQEAVGNSPYLNRKQAANWGFIARLANYDGIQLQETN